MSEKSEKKYVSAPIRYPARKFMAYLSHDNGNETTEYSKSVTSLQKYILSDGVVKVRIYENDARQKKLITLSKTIEI